MKARHDGGGSSRRTTKTGGRALGHRRENVVTHGGGGGMHDRMEKLMEIFQEAAESERQARIRYEEAAQMCQDPDLKRILLEFAADEQRHEEEVLNRFRDMAAKFAGGIN